MTLVLFIFFRAGNWTSPLHRTFLFTLKPELYLPSPLRSNLTFHLKIIWKLSPSNSATHFSKSLLSKRSSNPQNKSGILLPRLVLPRQSSSFFRQTPPLWSPPTPLKGSRLWLLYLPSKHLELHPFRLPHLCVCLHKCPSWWRSSLSLILQCECLILNTNQSKQRGAVISVWSIGRSLREITHNYQELVTSSS